MEADSGAPAMEAIRRWSGIEAPNAAARYALADMQALIAELERARAGMGFEEEPSGFEAALSDLKEPEAR